MIFNRCLLVRHHLLPLALLAAALPFAAALFVSIAKEKVVVCRFLCAAGKFDTGLRLHDTHISKRAAGEVRDHRERQMLQRRRPCISPLSVVFVGTSIPQ